jgi:hypothetical protein
LVGFGSTGAANEMAGTVSGKLNAEKSEAVEEKK